MKIGPVEIPALARLAPMAGITNAPFRLIARECGSGLTTSEEMDAAALLTGHPHADAIAAYYPEERPLAMQLLGKDPDLLARAAERCQALGADIVDLNMGCPMPKITGKGKGAALMRDVAATALILRALRKAVSVPLTVKIRGGWDDEHLNAVEVAQMAEAEGVDAITVHPRTRSQRFTGKAPWTIIREVVEAVSHPGHRQRRRPLDGRGAADGGGDGLRVGHDRPRRPRQPLDLRRGLREPARREPSAPTRRASSPGTCALIREHFGEKYALIQMKKHLAWYTEGLGHATECRARIFQTRAPTRSGTSSSPTGSGPRPATSQTASTVSPRIA